MSTSFALGIALVLLILVPFIPRLLRIRIRLLRWLHWNSLANHMESHFSGWVLFARTGLVTAVIIVLLCARW